MMVQRTFLPGDRWIYYKIYGGIKVLEEFLKKDILMILQEFNQIDSFFFIRYKDPDYHLRIRFLLKDQCKAENLMQVFNEYISKYINDHTIWDVSINTYVRELERYSDECISTVERLFCSNSLLTVKVLSEFTEEYRYYYGLLYLDKLLDAFGFSSDTKQKFLETIVDGFKTEFGFNKNLQIQMDYRCRVLGKKYSDMITNNDNEIFNQITMLLNESLINSSNDIQFIISRSNHQNVFSIISSLIHMHFNRLYKIDQRQSEFMSYYILKKISLGIQKRNEKKSKSLI